MKKGIFGMYKPKGMTSADVVRWVKRDAGKEKVGHAGTLDPLAEGVLVVAVGRKYTKKLGEELNKEKEYLAEIKLGFFSETDDEEGRKMRVNVASKPTIEEIETVLRDFVGNIKQITPVYSAAKISGKEAYKRARRGEKFTPPPRWVEIKSIDILNYNFPFLELKIITGPGVYIRSIARELGEKLSVGGYLADLKRTRVGDFAIENGIKIDFVEKNKPCFDRLN